MPDSHPTTHKPTISDLLREKKLQRILAARVYADSIKTARELEDQYDELLETASGEARAWIERQQHG